LINSLENRKEISTVSKFLIQRISFTQSVVQGKVAMMLRSFQHKLFVLVHLLTSFNLWPSLTINHSGRLLQDDLIAFHCQERPPQQEKTGRDRHTSLGILFWV
jgi:hypothetical protein